MENKASIQHRQLHLVINTNLKEASFCLSEKEGGSEQLTENVAFV